MTDNDATQEVRETWERVAPAWERHRAWVFEGFRHVSEWLIAQLDPQPGQSILELAAGPGETGFLVADLVGPQGRVISTDLAPGMVEAARHGAAARGLGNVECRVMDAQALDLPDQSVDGVLSRLGLMLVPDVGRTFAEVRRVLRPGGRLAYAVIGSPVDNQWMGLIMMALVQRGHRPVSGDPFGAAGPFSLSDPDRNRSLLADAGFDQVEVAELRGTVAFADPYDYWERQTQIGGPVAALVASLPPDEVTAARESLAAIMQPFAEGGGYALPSSVLGVSAAT